MADRNQVNWDALVEVFKHADLLVATVKEDYVAMDRAMEPVINSGTIANYDSIDTFVKSNDPDFQQLRAIQAKIIEHMTHAYGTYRAIYQAQGKKHQMAPAPGDNKLPAAIFTFGRK
jgi:hypothetical protein